jgi:GNAT superfamily N-acetyltransferase
MDEGMLLVRLWDGFARLQALLGGHAGPGSVLERDGMVASVVPSAPDSPTLNAAVAIEADRAPEHLEELRQRYANAKVRRWGVWLDGSASLAAQALAQAGMIVTSASPGMGATLDELSGTDADYAAPRLADLTTVGRVNDLAYGNYDARLERTLAPLPNGILKGYRADLHGKPAAVALTLHHGEDCGVSFVATIPKARRKGLASAVMRQALAAARESGCTTTTLQATEVGERLYTNLGYRHLCVMQLWERRP